MTDFSKSPVETRERSKTTSGSPNYGLICIKYSRGRENGRRKRERVERAVSSRFIPLYFFSPQWTSGNAASHRSQSNAVNVYHVIRRPARRGALPGGHVAITPGIGLVRWLVAAVRREVKMSTSAPLLPRGARRKIHGSASDLRSPKSLEDSISEGRSGAARKRAQARKEEQNGAPIPRSSLRWTAEDELSQPFQLCRNVSRE